jgi:hypothetical protein
MSIVKETSSGEHYLEKVKTEGDDPNISGLQMYQRNAGSDGASGNTVFTLSNPYSPGSNTLFVYVNGQKATLEVAATLANEYEETAPYTVTFGASLLAADVVEFIVIGAYPLDADEAADILGIVAGTKMYFYQAAAPVGWTIDTTLGDAVLAVHGSSSYYGSTGGGEQRGTWTQPDHNHSVSNDGAHSHQWCNYTSNTDSYSWNSGGSFIDMWTANSDDITGHGLVVRVDGASEKISIYDWYTDAEANHNHGGNTGNDATADTWRPFANVGIIATRD